VLAPDDQEIRRRKTPKYRRQRVAERFGVDLDAPEVKPEPITVGTPFGIRQELAKSDLTSTTKRTGVVRVNPLRNAEEKSKHNSWSFGGDSDCKTKNADGRTNPTKPQAEVWQFSSVAQA
jgi:hypothetical protein